MHSLKLRGGQALKDIRIAKQIFETAISNNNNLKDKIPNELNTLFDLVTEIDISDSIVYAVKIPDDLKGIECDINNVIYSNISMPKELILGKVLVPSSFGQNTFKKILIDKMIKKKLHTNDGLAIRIWKKNKNSL